MPMYLVSLMQVSLLSLHSTTGEELVSVEQPPTTASVGAAVSPEYTISNAPVEELAASPTAS